MLTVPSTDWKNDSGFGLDPQQFRNLTHSRVDKHLQGIKKTLYTMSPACGSYPQQKSLSN